MKDGAIKKKVSLQIPFFRMKWITFYLRFGIPGFGIAAVVGTAGVGGAVGTGGAIDEISIDIKIYII